MFVSIKIKRTIIQSAKISFFDESLGYLVRSLQIDRYKIFRVGFNIAEDFFC